MKSGITQEVAASVNKITAEGDKNNVNNMSARSLVSTAKISSTIYGKPIQHGKKFLHLQLQRSMTCNIKDRNDSITSHLPTNSKEKTSKLATNKGE